MAERQARPNPEALLKQARKEGRGRLKVFLGAAPGVGKTYAMLRAAHRRKAEGLDVCVGLIETHGRRETEALIQGLEILPRAQVEYRGKKFPELDVEAIVKRRPQLVLVDEYAHSNIPGSRYLKRHQDVDDLLAAGIDVYTTLNVQHLESLNDVVARITGVEVRETVPDQALDAADEIELVDLPPEELIQRLKEGKVYVPEQARHALNQFFGRGTLTALRELAMRTAAERVDAQMLEYRQTHAVGESWPTRERLLVCVSEADISQQVVRAARRVAEHRRVPWIAVHIETPRSRSLPDSAKDAIARNLRFAERLGAETLTVPGNDLIDELLNAARAHNASQIVVGRPESRRYRWPWKRSIAGELIRRAESVEVTVVTWAGEATKPPSAIVPRSNVHFNLRDHLVAVAIVLAATALAYPFDHFLGAAGIALLYLFAVLVVATREGLWPSVTASLLSFLLFNFFFTEPRFTFYVSSPRDVSALIAFLATALLAGNIGGRQREQLEALKRSSREAVSLAELSRQLAAASSVGEVVLASVRHLSATMSQEALVMRPQDTGPLLVAAESNNKRPLETIDHAAAKWAYENDKSAGWNTDTLPAAGWLFTPLATARGRLGVLGIHVTEGRRVLDREDHRMLDAVADLTAVAMERIRLVGDLEQSRVLNETEQLRAALLSSISHDLRTPLVSIMGAADNLLNEESKLRPTQRRELVETVIEESERLNRFVQNLLDMTRLAYGGLRPRLDWCDLREIVGNARARLRRVLAERVLVVNVPPEFPLLHADPALLEQVFVNVLDNAAKYSPPDTPIRIDAQQSGGDVVVRVIDRGSGIPAADREKVFDMFYRARNTDSRVAGTGLGLSICRGFVEAMEGTITAKPAPEGVGTTIEIRMPAREQPEQEAEAAE